MIAALLAASLHAAAFDTPAECHPVPGAEALWRDDVRYVFVGAEAIAYLRETPHDRLLCLASRSAHAPVRLPLGALGCSALETLYGGDATIAAGAAVLPAGGPAFHVWRLA